MNREELVEFIYDKQDEGWLIYPEGEADDWTAEEFREKYGEPGMEKARQILEQTEQVEFNAVSAYFHPQTKE
jgi:hypothetical protein